MPAGAAACRLVLLLVAQKGCKTECIPGLNRALVSCRLVRGDAAFTGECGVGDVTSSNAALPRQRLRAEVRKLAAAIREVEETLPGFFGEDAAIIRRQAAGDDVPPEVLQQTLGRLRLALMPVWLAHEVGLEVDAGRGVRQAWKRIKARFFRD